MNENYLLTVKLNVIKTKFKLLFIWSLALLIVSCSKDSEYIDPIDENIDQGEDIDSRAYVEDDCGYIDELCLKCKILIDKLPEEPTEHIPTFGLVDNGGSEGSRFEIDNNYLELVVNGEDYIVYPTNYFSNSDEFLVLSPDGNYIISNSDEEFVKNLDIGIRLPSSLDKILEISNAEFASGNLNINNLSTVFGGSSTINSLGGGNFRITTTDNGGGSARALDPCRGVSMGALSIKYVEFLGMNNFHSNGEEIIMDALNDCINPSFDPKESCVNSKCVVDNAINNPATGIASDHTIKLNYLKGLLDLSDEEYNQLKSPTPNNTNFINDLYESLDEERVVDCEDADCSLKQALKSIIGVQLYTDEELTAADIESTKQFYEDLYCDNGASYVTGITNELGPCALQYITTLLREGIENEAIVCLLDKFRDSYKLYYTVNNAYHQPLKEELMAEDVTWCDMIEITFTMYAAETESQECLIAGFKNSKETSTSRFGGPLLLFKALGEGFGDALAQSFFIWVADNGIDDFSTAIDNVDPYEVTLAFFKGFIPWTGTTQKIGAQLALDAGIAAIVVMDRAIEQENYTWEQAGNDFAATFTKYVVGDIFGAAFLKYGSTLVKGVIKKFDFDPTGFFGTKLNYSRIAKIMGGGLDDNPPYPSFSYTHPEFGLIEINPERMMKEWELTDEIFIIGKGIESRIEPYKNHLNSLGFNAKSICDNTQWDCSNFVDNQAQFDLNLQIIRDMKLAGVRILDLGEGGVPNIYMFNYYGMEIIQIFN